MHDLLHELGWEGLRYCGDWVVGGIRASWTERPGNWRVICADTENAKTHHQGSSRENGVTQVLSVQGREEDRVWGWLPQSKVVYGKDWCFELKSGFFGKKECQLFGSNNEGYEEYLHLFEA